MALTFSAIEFKFEEYECHNPELVDETATLLKIKEEDAEQLENDQMMVQGMMGSPYLAFFEQAVTTWSRKLGAVSDVLSVLLDIEKTWSYLEPLFIGSVSS